MASRVLPLLLLLVPLFVACSEGGRVGVGEADRDATGATASEAPQVVRTVTAEAGETGAWSLLGTVRARHEAERGFRVAGELRERAADPGDRVDSNQILARLDETDLRLEREAAAARLAEAQARAVFARSEAERMADMVTTEAASRQEYERDESEAEAAVHAVEAARAELALADSRLDYATLRAPAAATVMEVLAEPGEVLGTGAPVVRLAWGRREAEVDIPARRREAVPESARLPNGDLAELRDIAAGADPVSRTWRARYGLPDGFVDRPLGSTLRLHFRADAPVVRVRAGR